MLSQLIQRQIPIGSRVTFSLKNGGEISGILVELGLDHVTLKFVNGSSTILTEMIAGWQVMEEQLAATDEMGSTDTSVSSSSALVNQSSNTQITRKLLEIETRFQAQLQVATIHVRPPDFAYPNELISKQVADAVVVWNRIKDKYNYAAKINELSAKFGRIQPLVIEMKVLAKRFPNSAGIKRHLAYLLWLSNNLQEAINIWKDAALASQDVWDWYNVAALALTDGYEELALYGLEQFFKRTFPSTSLEAWYLYVKLVQKHLNYQALVALGKNKNTDFPEREREILLETGIYLLKTSGHEQLAMELVDRWLSGQSPIDLALEAFGFLEKEPSDSYQILVSEISKEISEKSSLEEVSNRPKGYIYRYIRERNYGFLQGVDGINYFFHCSAISDDELLDSIQNLTPGEQIPVVFETAQGPKGPVAIRISLYRTIDEMFARATEYANEGEYSKAIAQMKKVLELNPVYPNAKELCEKWREYARIFGVPKGSNPYARAKRAQLIEKDLDKAAQLLRVAISQGDNVESAIKDLAGLLAQQGKSEEAIQVLINNRTKIRDQQSVDNMLIGFYQNAGQYDEAIALLQKNLGHAPSEGKKAQVLSQIASCYLRKEDYLKAEQNFRAVLKLQPDNRTVQRNIAFCLLMQERYEEAERLLDRIVGASPDPKAIELLEAIKQARAGQVPQIDEEIIIETTLSDFSREISNFAQFFLDRCDFQGVPPDRVQKQTFNRGDIQKLEELAAELGTRRPRDRAGYYLSAAKIASLLEDEDPNQFYKYLCRSFASSGDAIVVDGRPLDTAREFYTEALAVYDGVRSRGQEQDAVNALVRFLFTTMGPTQIPIEPRIPSIDETLETVLIHHPDRSKVFEAIAYLVFRSRYAAKRILNRLYEKSSLQAMALEYLKSKGIAPIVSVRRLKDFVGLWNELIKRNSDEVRSISNEFRLLGSVELTTASLESSIERMKRLVERLFLDLDQQRAMQLQKIFELALDLCKEVTFEEQERLCIQISNRCQEMLSEIETSPTKLSVEEMYPVVEAIQKKIRVKLEDLYERSTPQVTLRLPVESYTPDHNRRIEVQVVVSNRIGCSPAEALELAVQKYEDTFTVKLDGSLRGGDQRILKVPIQVSEEELQSRAFSLSVYAQYRTRTDEILSTPVNNFSIRLYPEEEFEEIPNPYAAYAEGGIVKDPAMFYGREELIANLAKVLQEPQALGKCIVIYGQKRAGKSSILYHLKRELELNKDLLVLDLSIGSILDAHSSSPFLYRIFFAIMRKLEYAIEDRIEEGYSQLDLSFPSDQEFYEHPSPLTFFQTLLERFRRAVRTLSDWNKVRLILLIDEFSYIYEYITKGYIPESFMKNWKALLQEGYFSAVLAGQDVMPKFKQRFPNEFGTTQDERVTYLKREDAVRLIDEPLRIGGRQGESRYRERAIDRIIDLTACSPFYIQILCNRLVEYMNRKRASLVTEADVEQVKEELIRGANALTMDKFDNLLNSGDTSEDAISDEDALKVLTAIAVNSRTGPCSRHSIVCETRTPIDQILDDLVKRDVVERERGQYFTIRVGLFKEWLVIHQ